MIQNDVKIPSMESIQRNYIDWPFADGNVVECYETTYPSANYEMRMGVIALDARYWALQLS